MKHFFVTFFIAGILVVSSYVSAQAVVVQSAKDALTNDIFVYGPKISRQSSKAKHNRTNTKAKKAEQKNVSSSQNKATQKTKDTSQQKTPSQEESPEVQETPKNPNAGYGYTKKYASKLFKTFSGYITIEQKNIPSRIGVTKGSTLQINLKETPDAIWNVELDEKIGKITSNKVNGNQRILIIQAINSGNTRLFLDNISIKDKKYKVIFSKKMSLLVDE